MQHYTNFGAEARKILLQKNITMTALAEELGISVTYLSEIFKGTRNGKKYKERIANILGMESEVTK